MPKGIAALSLVLALVLISITGCRRQSGPGASGQKQISIAVSTQPASAAVYVAHTNHYFEDEGLHVKLKSCAAGKDALAAVTAGKAQFATVTETPIVLAALNGERVYIIATIADVDKYASIVARKDRGISTPADLRGKKIGLAPGTTAEFFLHVYLTLNHLSQKDVKVIGLAADKVDSALITGRVDAVCTWAPHAEILGSRLGNNALILSDPSAYTLNWNIAVTQKYAKSHPATIERLLRAIIRATSFINDHPDEAHAISARYIGADSRLYESEWKKYRFTTVLDQSLILSLEDQARWMLEREGSTRKPPNFVDFIYTSGLESVDPQAVRIAGR